MPRAERKAKDRQRLSQCNRETKIIKLLDRIDNLQDAIFAPAGFRRLYAEESLLLADALLERDHIINDLVVELQRLCGR